MTLVPPEPGKHLDRERDSTAEEFYRRLAKGRLATTRCGACGVIRFPPRSRCSACGTRMAWVDLPSRGRLHAFTTQETALRFGAPLVLALAEVGPVVVPGLVHAPFETLEIDQEVDVRTESVDALGLHVCRFEVLAS
jgi:uncharacterized OB-fold protein